MNKRKLLANDLVVSRESLADLDKRFRIKISLIRVAEHRVIGRQRDSLTFQVRVDVLVHPVRQRPNEMPFLLDSVHAGLLRVPHLATSLKAVGLLFARDNPLATEFSTHGVVDLAHTHRGALFGLTCLPPIDRATETLRQGPTRHPGNLHVVTTLDIGEILFVERKPVDDVHPESIDSLEILAAKIHAGDGIFAARKSNDHVIRDRASFLDDVEAVH